MALAQTISNWSKPTPPTMPAGYDAPGGGMVGAVSSAEDWYQRQRAHDEWQEPGLDFWRWGETRPEAPRGPAPPTGGGQVYASPQELWEWEQAVASEEDFYGGLFGQWAGTPHEGAARAAWDEQRAMQAQADENVARQQDIAGAFARDWEAEKTNLQNRIDEYWGGVGVGIDPLVARTVAQAEDVRQVAGQNMQSARAGYQDVRTWALESRRLADTATAEVRVRFDALMTMMSRQRSEGLDYLDREAQNARLQLLNDTARLTDVANTSIQENHRASLNEVRTQMQQMGIALDDPRANMAALAVTHKAQQDTAAVFTKAWTAHTAARAELDKGIMATGATARTAFAGAAATAGGYGLSALSDVERARIGAYTDATRSLTQAYGVREGALAAANAQVLAADTLEATIGRWGEEQKAQNALNRSTVQAGLGELYLTGMDRVARFASGVADEPFVPTFPFLQWLGELDYRGARDSMSDMISIIGMVFSGIDLFGRLAGVGAYDTGSGDSGGGGGLTGSLGLNMSGDAGVMTGLALGL